MTWGNKFSEERNKEVVEFLKNDNIVISPKELWTPKIRAYINFTIATRLKKKEQ
jgi:hypothetical protein